MAKKMTGVIYGGKWEELGDERIQRWPSKIGDKRPLKIKLSSWVGVSIGAKHVYLEIEEEDNQRGK